MVNHIRSGHIDTMDCPCHPRAEAVPLHDGSVLHYVMHNEVAPRTYRPAPTLDERIAKW